MAGLSAVGAIVSGSCGLWLGASGPHLVSWNCSTMWQLASEAERVTEREREREGNQDGSCSIFYNFTSGMTYYHLCHVLLVTQTNPGTMWEGTI